MNKILLVGFTIIALIAVFFGASYLHKENKTAQANQVAKENETNLIRSYSPFKGKQDAKVTIVEFFDPACEACRAYHPYVSKIQKDYPDQVRVVMRYTPIHKGSDLAAAILDAAKIQGKFWETLAAMFDGQDIWASHHNPQPEKIWQVIESVGLDINKIKEDIKSLQISRNIKQDLDDLTQLGISQTPSFFVNGKPLIDLSPQELIEKVEAEL